MPATSQNVPPTPPRQAEFLDLLKRVEAQLQEAKWNLTGKDTADTLYAERKLIESLTVGTTAVRNDYQRPDSYVIKGATTTAADDGGQRKCAIAKALDPVLAFILADRMGDRDVARRFWPRALEAYIAAADAYDSALGELMYPGLREKTAAQIAKHKFLHGSNPTALGDWSGFWGNLGSPTTGYPTGLAKLDEMLGGGFHGLTVIGANESGGKTSLCLNMMRAALLADAELGCLFLSVDQPKQRTMEQFLCLAAGLNRACLAGASPQKRNEILDGRTNLRLLLSRIKFLERSNLPANQPVTCSLLVDYWRQFQDASKISRGILVIDLFQSLDLFPDAIATDNDRDEYRLTMIREFIDRSKSARNPQGFPVLVTSEVRKVDRDALTANDLRGSARMGSVPDNILLLWPPEGSNQFGDSVARVLKVSKARQGEQGILPVTFYHKTCRFTEDVSPNVTPVAQAARKKARGADADGLDPADDM